MEQELQNPLCYKGEGGGPNQVSLVGPDQQSERKSKDLLWDIHLFVVIVEVYA